jgi:hypothetical protein
MNIQDIIDKIQEISLKHKYVKSFNTGSVPDMSDSKSSETYPMVWFETPVLITYTNRREKRYTFALNVLSLAKPDDVKDEINMQSQCEVIADDILQTIQDSKDLGTENFAGLTVKAINSDLAVGVRIDLTIITNRTCDYKLNFN